MKNCNLIRITDDLFDVAARLTSVRAGYAVYFNRELNRFEVYDNDSFAFVVPYDELDSRTIDYARKTATRNADELFAEIDRHNDELTKTTAKNIVNKTLTDIDSRRQYDR